MARRKPGGKRRFHPIAALVDAAERRLTPAGRLVLVISALAAGFGLDTTLSLSYQVFSLGLAALAVGAIGTRSRHIRVELRRSAGHLATVGERFAYMIEIRNLEAYPVDDCKLRDDLELDPALPAPSMPPVGLLARIGHQVRMRKIGLTAAPAQRFGGAQRDRRWRRGNSIREVSVEPLGCGESRQIGFAFVPQRRGTVRFKGASLFRTDPLGLVRSSQRLPLPGRLVVLPRRYPVAPFALPGARRLQRRGVANAGKVGESEDFLGLRDYRPGDSPKQIHWRSWARMGRPIVRENEDEYFTRHALILDTFCTENETDLLDAATSVAASLALTAEDNESLLDLVLVEDRTYRLTAGRGVGDVTSLLEVIANARPAPRSHLPLLAAALRPLADSSSGAIFVLLGWDDERAALVRETALAGVATLAILIRRDGDPAPDLGDTIVPVRSVRTGHLAGDLLQL